MSIISSEIKLYKSLIVNDTSANGGVMSSTLITSGVRGNLFPDVHEAERISGITRWRKLFVKIENDDDLTAANIRFFMKNPTPAEDFVFFIEATQTNTQGNIVGTEQKYGAGSLHADVAAGDSSIVVDIEDSSLDIFKATENTIWISDGTNEEYHKNVSASLVGTQYTLTFESGDVLQNAYSVGNGTKVASVFEKSEVKCLQDNWSVSSTNGDYDYTNHPLVLDNIGTIEEVWTFTFSSASEYNCIGAGIGSVGSGNVTTDFSPINSDFGKPYFTLDSSGFSGTFQAGDTLTVITHPAALPIFIKQTVPAGAVSAANSFTLRFRCESE